MVMGRSIHHALDRDPILRAISSFYGITSADGNPGGTTLFCSALIGANDFITGKTILLQSGLAIFEGSGATGFISGTGQITVNPAFSSQVLAGAAFYVLNASSAATLPIVLGIVTNIFGLVNADLVLTETGGTVTASGIGTEDNIYINDDPAGEYYPRKVVIDLFDLDVAESATIRTYYRIKSPGTARLKDEVIFNGVQAEPMKNIELEPNRFGCSVTIEATAGVVVDWEAHREE